MSLYHIHIPYGILNECLSNFLLQFSKVGLIRLWGITWLTFRPQSDVCPLQNKGNDDLILFDFSDYLFKLLLIGDSGVGKSCLLLRFAVIQFILLG